MPVRPAIRVEGLDELRRNLRRVKDSELDDEMKSIHQALAREIVDKALPNVPVRSGRLKASVRSAGTKRDAVGRVGSASVPYAPIIHWGWPARNITGRPFLREAAQQIERGVTDRYETEVAQMLDRVIGER